MLNTFPLSFTDVFGVQHPNAVAMISAVSSQGSVMYGVDGAESAVSGSLSYQVRFWHSEVARVAGAQPQNLTTGSPSIGANGIAIGSMSITGDAANLPRAEWAEACRAHFETAVLPTLAEVQYAN